MLEYEFGTIAVLTEDRRINSRFFYKLIVRDESVHNSCTANKLEISDGHRHDGSQYTAIDIKDSSPAIPE